MIPDRHLDPSWARWLGKGTAREGKGHSIEQKNVDTISATAIAGSISEQMRDWAYVTVMMSDRGNEK